MSQGAFVISFDFELAWGMRASEHELGRFDGIERVREVVDGLLKIFTEFDIGATWATVGHLMLTEQMCQEGRYNYDLPAPKHAWYKGEWYRGIPTYGEERADQYYAPELVERIVNCPVYQELASHTFSHVEIGDAGCDESVARAEFQRTRELARHWGREIKSVVFPRNRIGHLRILEETGYTCYRAHNSEWYWFGRPYELYQSKLLKLPVSSLRFVDERLLMSCPLPSARKVGKLWEIPHSMFFPGFSGVSKYVPAMLRAKRASLGLQAAARRGRIYSLYTHPHNFLPKPAPLLDAFRQICREAAQLRDAGKLDIITMDRIAEDLENGRNLHWT